MKSIINTTLITNHMQECGLSRTKFAQLCNLSLPSLNKLLKNNGNVELKSAIKIARYFKVELKDIFI